jgi:hypothetical protein
LVELRPSAPFDSWHITRNGLGWRALPRLKVTCVSVDNPPQAFTSIEAGMFTKDSPEEQTGPAVMDSLSEAIRTGSPSVSPIVQNELHPDTMWPLIFAYGGTVLCVLIAFGVTRSVRSAKTP